MAIFVDDGAIHLNTYLSSAIDVATQYHITAGGAVKICFDKARPVKRAFTLVCGRELSANANRLKEVIHLFRLDFSTFVNAKDKKGTLHLRPNYKGLRLQPNDINLRGDASNPRNAFLRACVSFQVTDKNSRQVSVAPFAFLTRPQMHSMSDKGVEGIIFEKNGVPGAQRTWIDLSYARRPVPKGF